MGSVACGPATTGMDALPCEGATQSSAGKCSSDCRLRPGRPAHLCAGRHSSSGRCLVLAPCAPRLTVKRLGCKPEPAAENVAMPTAQRAGKEGRGQEGARQECHNAQGPGTQGAFPLQSRRACVDCRGHCTGPAHSAQQFALTRGVEPGFIDCRAAGARRANALRQRDYQQRFGAGFTAWHLARDYPYPGLNQRPAVRKIVAETAPVWVP